MPAIKVQKEAEFLLLSPESTFLILQLGNRLSPVIHLGNGTDL